MNILSALEGGLHIRLTMVCSSPTMGSFGGPWTGVFSSSALQRTMAKMMALEGLFRKLGAATGRDRDSTLRRMVALRVPRGVDDDPAMDAQWFEHLRASATAMEPASPRVPVDYAGGEGHHQMFWRVAERPLRERSRRELP